MNDQAKVFEVTFQSVIEVTRTYQADDEDEAKDLAQMDAEDGQVGGFHERQSLGGQVVSSREID